VQAGYLVQKYLRNDPAAHIHAHFAHGPCTTALYAAALTGTEYSFTAHAKDIYVQEEGFLRTKLDRAKFVVTCTGFNRRTLQNVHDGTPIHRIYHGVDCTAFGERKESLDHDVPHILSVGRLVPKKGFPTLFKALALIAERGRAFRCTIIGDGPQKAELEALVQKLGLTDHIEFTGKLTQEEVIGHYAAADCISLACQVLNDGDRDGIPNVLVEAMAMGVPVVSTRISGIPELVEDEVTGLLVESGDSAALSISIERVLSDPALAQRLSEAGRARVTEEHDSTMNTRLLGLIFEEALGVNETEKHEANKLEKSALVAGAHCG
jgi:glycosyltransferase involved in cell wall biosynthesis